MTGIASRFQPIYWIKRISKIVTNKWVAIIFTVATLGIIGINTANNDTSADAQIDTSRYMFGTVYQYATLSNSTIADGAKDTKVPVMGTNLGNGGISGSFSYDGIVTDAPSSKRDYAKAFSVMMATYSTYNYMSVAPNGVNGILPAIIRGLVGLIILPAGFVLDVVSMLSNLIGSVIVKFNLINFFAGILADTSASKEMAGYLGLTLDQLRSGYQVLMIAGLIMIIISLIVMLNKLGRGSVDRRSRNKLLGRVFMFALFPITMIVGSEILSDITGIAGTNQTVSAVFSDYFVDTESWAKLYNFSPSGSDRTDDGSFVKHDGYVDTTLNPYTSLGKKRIGNINKGGSLAKNTAWSNSGFALAYISSQTFTARDYLDYEGTSESRDAGAFGSYYAYAVAHPNRLADVDNDYRSSLDGSTIKKSDGDNYPATGYSKAIDDYVGTDKDGKKNANVQNAIRAWQDRFIYGTKNSGDKLSDYYAVSPSAEQIQNSVGTGQTSQGTNTNGKYSLSDQTMFLVLSTKFNANGGTYYINAPQNGVMAKFAQFDSDRGTYYSVSMVGTPIYSVPAMLGKAVITLISLIALIMAVFSMGIVDFNLRVLRSWVKGVSDGSPEYGLQFIVLAVGLGGTYLLLSLVPGILISSMNAISSIIGLTFNTSVDYMSLDVRAGLAYQGMKLVLSSVVAYIFAIGFWKSENFRNKIVGFYLLIYAWAVATANQLESRATAGQPNNAGAMSQMHARRQAVKQKIDGAKNMAIDGAIVAATGGAGAGVVAGRHGSNSGQTENIATRNNPKINANVTGDASDFTLKVPNSDSDDSSATDIQTKAPTDSVNNEPDASSKTPESKPLAKTRVQRNSRGDNVLKRSADKAKKVVSDAYHYDEKTPEYNGDSRTEKSQVQRKTIGQKAFTVAKKSTKAGSKIVTTTAKAGVLATGIPTTNPLATSKHESPITEIKDGLSKRFKSKNDRGENIAPKQSDESTPKTPTDNKSEVPATKTTPAKKVDNKTSSISPKLQSATPQTNASQGNHSENGISTQAIKAMDKLAKSNTELTAVMKKVATTKPVQQPLSPDAIKFSNAYKQAMNKRNSVHNNTGSGNIDPRGNRQARRHPKK